MAFYECPGDGNSDFIREAIKEAHKKSAREERDCSKLAYKGKPEGIIDKGEVLYQHGKLTSNVIPFKLKDK